MNDPIANCPIRQGMRVLGGKWALLILFHLKEPTRYGELKRKIPDISEKMLIQTLRNLEEHEFLKRVDFQTIPPKVEYSITPKAERALDIVPILVEVMSAGEGCCLRKEAENH